MKQENIDILNSSKSKDKKNKAGEWLLNNSPDKESIKLVLSKCSDTSLLSKGWDMFGEDISSKTSEELEYIIKNSPNPHFVKVASEQLDLRNSLGLV